MLDRPIDFDHWDLHQDVLGIDEAGRGPIAGPLVVAGVCFEKGFTNEMIDDSKKLTEKKREALFSLITNEALWYQILVIEEKIIDKKNIYRTTQEAMLEIAHNAPVDIVLSDAMPLPSLDKEWESVIKGDQKSLSIAAASILAKVTRDRYMKKLDDFVSRRTLAVKGLNNQYQMRACYDKAAQFYKKPVRKTGKTKK